MPSHRRPPPAIGSILRRLYFDAVPFRGVLALCHPPAATPGPRPISKCFIFVPRPTKVATMSTPRVLGLPFAPRNKKIVPTATADVVRQNPAGICVENYKAFLPLCKKTFAIRPTPRVRVPLFCFFRRGPIRPLDPFFFTKHFYLPARFARAFSHLRISGTAGLTPIFIIY